MSVKKISIALLVLVIAVAGIFAYRLLFPKAKIHYHAGFVVWVDGKKQDFAKPEFMSLVPCGGPDNHKFDQLEKAHLHDMEGQVVHVHRDNALWADLFKNITFPLPAKPLEAYVNGTKTTDILNQKIQPYESVVILIGTHEAQIKDYLKQAVSISHIKAVEKKSESCGT